MNKTNFKRLTIISAAALVSLSASAIVFSSRLGSPNSLTKATEVNHDANCVFNHYSAVDRTFSTHGSKEFWACCTHWGSHVLVDPSAISSNITDKGALTGNAFDEMSSDDDRYIPAINEGDALYDASTTDMVNMEGSSYPFTCTTSRGVDETYGNYFKLSDVKSSKTSEGDQNFWVRPGETLNENISKRTTSKNISKYKKIVFYVKCSMDATVGLWGADWARHGSFAVTKDTWTEISVDIPGSDSDHPIEYLNDLSPNIWSIGESTFDFYVTSYYGLGLDPFSGMEKVYDAGTKDYTNYNWVLEDANTGSEAYISKGYKDKTYGDYALIDIKKSAKSDQVWVKPNESVSLSGYSKVLLYVYTNKAMSIGIMNPDYVTVVASKTFSVGWNAIEVDLTALPSQITAPTTNDIAVYSWYQSSDNPSPITDVTWKITSIYGVKA